MNPIFRQKKQYRKRTAEHAGIHTYFATFSEPCYCPLFTLLLVADLSHCLSGTTCKTKALEPSELLLEFSATRELLTSLEASPHLPQHLGSRTAVLGDLSKQFLTNYFRADA